ncbi:MAG: hypothetical protein H0Z24_03180 [Thermosipho sp. (in: Bacteria)]|nr:hypothetical protein [Thermosipho sp. (in: thermotogales)]
MNLEKMTFAEFISQCDVSHWELINSAPDPIVEDGDYVIVCVVPAEDPDFLFREDIPTPEGAVAVVDWGLPVAITDDPWQEAYTIYKRSGHTWKCTGQLFATLEEAREGLCKACREP